MSESRRAGRFQGLADALRDMPGGPAASGRPLAQLREHWSAIVGSPLDSHCRPVLVRPPELVVQVTSHVWMNTLSTMQRRLVEAIDRHCPELEISRLRVQLGAAPQPAATTPADAGPSSTTLAAVELEPEELQRLEAIAAIVKDPEVREQLRQTLFAQARLRRWRGRQGGPPQPAPRRRR